MSLKAGFVLFYVSFMTLLILFSSSMAIDIINVNQDKFTAFSVPPTSGNVLIDFVNFVFNVIGFGFTTFGFLVQVSADLVILNLILIIPLTATFLWILLELARGN